MTYRWLTAGAALGVALAGIALIAGRHDRAPRVLWYDGRPVRWAGTTGVVLAPAGELLLFRPGPRTERLPLEPQARQLLEAAVDARGAVWLVDGDGNVLRAEPGGALRHVGRTGFDVPTLAAGPGGLWAARSPIQFTFRPESTGTPLAARYDTSLTRRAAAGTASVPDNPFLAQLANASQVLALPDGGAVVAPFVRDEVVRYDRAGREVWRTARGLTHATPNPTMLMRRVGGRPRVVADYAPVNLGLGLGPDGTIYVLSTPRATTAESRLDALDPATGAVRRTERFDTALPTLIADRHGAVRRLDAGALVRGDARREPFAPFALVGVGEGRDSLRWNDVGGRIVLVNFWASWCAPCREEMPALDSLAASFDTSRVVFVALSDDVDGAAAREFLLVFGGFPRLRVGLGLGRLKRDYHYVGLPFTVLVGGDGRIVRRWYGYGGPLQIAQIGAAIRAELGEAGGHEHR